MKATKVFSSLIFFIFVAVSFLSAGNSPIIQSRVFIETKTEWLALRGMHLDQVWSGENYIEIVTDREELNRIEALGIKTQIVHANLTQHLQSRLPQRGMGDYKTLAEINAYLDNIIASYPGIVSAKTSIGQTIEGREMWAVKISDNPNIDEDEPEVLYTSCIHAREVITPEVLFYFIDHLTQNYGTDPTVTDLVDNRELWFVIVCNPDGYYHNEVIEPLGGGMWRKNRRDNGDGEFGVDLNRNWGYMWGLDDVGSSPNTEDNTYRGTSAFSEPETQNLKTFTEAHDFVIAVYYHAYSNLILWPWGYDQIYTPDEAIYAAFGDSVQAMNGYAPGPGWVLYVTNGASDDWYYGEQTTKEKIYSFTFEVGSYDDNFWPPANRISDLVSENLEPNLFIADIADRMERLAPPVSPVVMVADTVPANGYDVDWSHDDSINTAVEYELNELSNYQIVTDAADDFDYWENKQFSSSSSRSYSESYSFYSGASNGLFRHITLTETYLVQPGDTIRFMTWYDIEIDWDYAYVEVSTDGVNFESIEGNLTTTTNPNGNNHGHGITGVSGGWVEGLFGLDAYVGQEIYYRLLYNTDGAVIDEGIYFDDIYPVCFYAQDTAYTVAAPATNLSFSDKTEGVYFYRVRARDVENQWSQYSNFAGTVAIVTFICGDANGDETLNVGDAVYVINYVFKNGAAPDPLEAGDANCDGVINVGDAVYLINFVFKGGPDPCASCP
ncbi:MAG: hypothetical protein GY841_18440 [FCB group bacterium]|nr:hypothetical protein [FCB group bacterium]